MVSSAILQVHPTRFCNLECLHCYSISGPREHEVLPIDKLVQVLDDAKEEGYQVLSVSGGEPLLYKPLPELLSHAHHLGLRTSVTTNGMLLTPRRLAFLADYLDLLAISLDGVPASHNRIRNSDRAFSVMAGNLQTVRRLGVRFGFIFTLTRHNLNELDWVYSFALENGASLLQIHPLEMVGRAVETLAGSDPAGIELAIAVLQWLKLRSLAPDGMRIQIDLADHRTGHSDKDRFVPPEASDLALSHLVSPLVVSSDGTVQPFVHGINSRFALGTITQSRLRNLGPPWIQGVYPLLRALCERTLAVASERTKLPFFNWYQLLVEQSHTFEHEESQAMPMSG